MVLAVAYLKIKGKKPEEKKQGKASTFVIVKCFVHIPSCQYPYHNVRKRPNHIRGLSGKGRQYESNEYGKNRMIDVWNIRGRWCPAERSAVCKPGKRARDLKKIYFVPIMNLVTFQEKHVKPVTVQ